VSYDDLAPSTDPEKVGVRGATRKNQVKTEVLKSEGLSSVIHVFGSYRKFLLVPFLIKVWKYPPTSEGRRLGSRACGKPPPTTGSAIAFIKRS